MNHKLLLLLALSYIAFSGSSLVGEIEYAPAPPSTYRPAAKFAYSADGSLELTVSISGPESDPDKIEVTVKTADGLSLHPETTSTPGVYRLHPNIEGALRVRMEPSSSLAGNFGSSEADVYFGDFDRAIRELKMRCDALDPAPIGTSLLERQLQDQRLWLEHWLEVRATESHPSEESPAEGKLVSAFLYAWEMVSLSERGKDSQTLVQGRQLPARRSFAARDSDSEHSVAFDYILRIPSGTVEKKYPLLVIVHGFTPSPNIIGGLRPELDDVAERMDFPFITAAPVFDGDMRVKRGWSPDELAGFVESLLERFPIDRNRVYLTGFSMGGLAVNRLTAHRPDLFAAVAPLCGTGDFEWAKAMAPVPVYLYHGDEDGAVSCYRSLVMHNALRKSGADPNLKIYNGVGHPVWSVTYAETEFYEKLLRHRRLPALGHATIGAIQNSQGGARLETMDELPGLDHSHVCWIDETFDAGDLLKGRNVRGKTVARLEQLFPNYPITGNILVALPEGMKNETSPARIGIALESPASLPPGFVVEPLRADGPSAMLRYCSNTGELTEAARQYEILATAEKAPEDGLLLEWEFSDSRDGNRFVIRSLRKNI